MVCNPIQGFVVAPVTTRDTVFFVFCVMYKTTALFFNVPLRLYAPGTNNAVDSPDPTETSGSPWNLVTVNKFCPCTYALSLLIGDPSKANTKLNWKPML